MKQQQLELPEELNELALQEFARLDGIFFTQAELQSFGVPVVLSQLLTQPMSNRVH